MLEPDFKLEYNEYINGLNVIIGTSFFNTSSILSESKIVFKDLKDIVNLYAVTDRFNKYKIKHSETFNISTSNKIFNYHESVKVCLLHIKYELIDITLETCAYDLDYSLSQLDKIIKVIKEKKLRDIINK